MKKENTSRKQTGSQESSDRAEESKQGTSRKLRIGQTVPKPYPFADDGIQDGQFTTDPPVEYRVSPRKKKKEE